MRYTHKQLEKDLYIAVKMTGRASNRNHPSKEREVKETVFANQREKTAERARKFH